MSEKSPKNLEEALKLIEQLQTEITQLHEENKKLEVVANNLSEMLSKSRKMMFGKSSEQIKNMYGYELLTANRQFYADNYPEIVLEKGSIDQVNVFLMKGERL